MKLILGSSSPRRQEILGFFSIPFEQIPSQFAEETVLFMGDPEQYVKKLSQEKAKALAKQHPNRPILTADTTVFHNGKIYNKPKDKEEARFFLSQLANSWHSVFTGMTLAFEGKLHTLCEETKILFHPLSPLQIDLYLNKINFLDKAGAYAIQQGGSILVKKIDGCYYNVMGLALAPLQELLAKIHIDLWQYLKIL